MPTQNPFLNVTHAQWMDRTKVTGFAMRHGTLREIDELYKQAWALARRPGASFHFYEVLRRLQTAIEIYLVEHKATTDFKDHSGNDLNRNQRSGGLMKQTYDFIRETLGAQKSVPKHDSRHTRVGVLFLFGHMRASMSTLSILSSSANLAASTATLGTTVARKPWESADLNVVTVNDPIAKMNKAAQAGIKVGGLIANRQVSESSGSRFERILEAVKGLFQKLEKYLKVGSDQFFANAGQILKAAARFVVGKLSSAAPVVGGAMDIVSGFFSACSAAMNYLDTKGARSGFHLVSGHPSLLATNIENAMKSDISAGVIKACKGALSLAAGSVTFGIASAAAGIVGAVVEFFSRYLESKRIEKFCEKASQHYLDLKASGYEMGDAEANKGRDFTQVVDKVDLFREFYQEGVDASVAVPILTLNSGICGDLMQMIEMYKSDNTAITQDAFDAAHGYFQRLKLWGGLHVRGQGITFASDRPDVSRLLRHAMHGHEGTATAGSRMMSMLAA